jgi:hypothetical protein
VADMVVRQPWADDVPVHVHQPTPVEHPRTSVL